MSTRSIRRAIIPANGIGADLQPATKAVPTGMLPLVDRPLVQYAVEEALEAGIEEILIVTGHGKTAIEDHFDCAPQLVDALRRSGCQQALEMVERNVVRPSTLAYIRQQEVLGLGHALWCARHVIGNEPFAVLIPEDVFLAQHSCLAQMTTAYRQTGGNLAAVAPLESGRRARHGSLEATPRDGRLLTARRFAALPAPGDPILNWAVVGRFILEPAFVEWLRPSMVTAGETEMAVALATAAEGGALNGYAFMGQHFDCSDTLGLFEANVAFTLARPDLGSAARTLVVRHARLARTRTAVHSTTRGLAIPA